MNIIKSEKKLCLLCMEEHEVDTVKLLDEEIFKGEELSFEATYEYCANSDEYLETEEMIKANSLAMKDAYRTKVGLLTSEEIIRVRQKYKVSQKDFSEILDWGKATITRYENHQVQDRAHDEVLRKIDNDPKWFLSMLLKARKLLSDQAFQKYLKVARDQYENNQNQYLKDTILAVYSKYEDDNCTGGVNLNLDKVVEMINYLAKYVKNLHLVKLLKMLWYADSLHFKRTGKAISGMVYSSLPMGAVPEGYELIIRLSNVSFEQVTYGEKVAYKFHQTQGFEYSELCKTEQEALNDVITSFGRLNADQIVQKMHDEVAYKVAEDFSIISYAYADKLSID